MSPSRINVIWLDDEFGTDSERVLSVWQRPFVTGQGQDRAHLLTCNQVEHFAKLVRDGIVEEGQPTRRHYDLIILDIMLNLEEGSHFGALGFADESIIPMDAGAQLAGLLRSTFHDDRRPEWLRPYVEVPLILLSSSPLVVDLVMDHIGHRRMSGVEIFSKSLHLGSGAASVAGSPEYLTCVDAMLRKTVG